MNRRLNFIFDTHMKIFQDVPHDVMNPKPHSPVQIIHYGDINVANILAMPEGYSAIK